VSTTALRLRPCAIWTGPLPADLALPLFGPGPRGFRAVSYWRLWVKHLRSFVHSTHSRYALEHEVANLGPWGGAFVILWPREPQGRAPGGIWGLKRRVRDHKSVDEHCTGDHGVQSSVLYGQPTASTEKQRMISPKAVFVGRIACSANGQWRPWRPRALQSSPAATGAPMMVGVPCKSITYTC